MALELQLTHSLRSFVAAVELSVGSGATFALVGPSGAGKTTVLRAISGLLTPEEGRIAVTGETWLDTSRRIDLPPERRRVGYLFQEYALFPHLDVTGNVRFGAGRRLDVETLLQRFRIAHLRHARVADLSGASASASPSRARSPATRPCSCSTSRWRRSTHTPAPPCAPSCTSSWPVWRSRPCS
ncbi:MAG: ATP-binding cassette domain-containing protein [Gaiella sp.]|nr:ATP-binding cassette domain-containing protein [Gaiella sp.]